MNTSPSNRPLVSIIIPCFNSEKYILSCLNSVLDQDYENIEIIVIDDGSTDDTLKILEQKKKCINNLKVISQPNLGACVARNRGIDISKGVYIKFLDSDDLLEKGAISKQVNTTQLSDPQSIVYGDYYLLVNNKKKLQTIYIEPFNQTSILMLKDLLIATPLHKRWMLKEVGGFDERLKNGQEWNLHVRLSSFGFKFIHEGGNPIFTYRIHDSINRISNKRANMSKKINYEIDKLDITLERLGPNIDPTFNSALAMKYLWIARAYLRAGNIYKARTTFKKAINLTEDYKLYWPKYYSLTYRLLGFYLAEVPLSIAKFIKGNKYTR